MSDPEDIDMESSSSSGDSEENEADCDQWFDTNSFSCALDGGYRPDLTSKSAEYMEENTHLLGMFMEAEDPDKVVTFKKDYQNLMELAFYLDNLEMIRKCCKTAFAKFGYDDFKLLVWLYRELREWETTKNDSILECIYNIFKEALSQKYSSIIVYKFIHFAPYSAHKEEIWRKILDVYLYDFTATAKYVSFWKDFYLEDPPDNVEKCQKVIDVYTKALSIPHLDSEGTLRDFQELCSESPEQYRVDWEAIAEKHRVASAKFQSIAPHESAVIDAADVEKPRMFRKYLEAPETASFDRKWVQFIYERMVGECALIPGCWIAYVRYRQDLDDVTDSSGQFFNQSALEIINRALIFTKTSEDLFSIKMELVESNNFTVTPLLTVMDDALRAPFSSPDPHTNLWIEYLTILRRHTSTDSEEGRQLLRRNFENAWESLSQQWGNLADQNGEILKMWANLEYTDLGDPAKGKSLWQEVMSFGDNSTRSATWLEFILLEKQKNPPGARKIFKKAIKLPELMDSDVLANAWVRFERLHGSRENLQYCQTLTEEIMAEREKNEREEENRRKKKVKDLKRKPKESPGRESAPVKKPKVEVKQPEVPQNVTPSSSTRDPTKDNVTIFMSNLDYSVTEDEIKTAFPELSAVKIDMVRSSSGKNRGFCYIELETAEKVQEALKFDRRPINGRPAYISGCLRERGQREKIFKYSEQLEPTKLFIKGCGGATKEELEEIFKPYGELKDVRVVFHKNGNPKGIAYVEFVEETAASAALLKVDQYQLGKNTLSVSISAPPQRGQPRNVQKVESLGAAKRLLHPGEMRPRMAFIPRSVQQKSTKNGQ
ncbi:squamous cell carcinoma antigen recognized by T-cells 3 [Phlebotomus argentipes]|uniref:squamous cell carcinoma antigen recognized by T-cells 3 n=1 Tax=Phlebotomus argentipes TaxID=94469 RepID=UPI0028935D51|nr:squamous cell carcinoma antigen recognized by T-cells 3 [Phlebotomus argentipes]